MKTLGQVAYEAYCQHSFDIALATGIITQKWDELSDRVKQVWQAAADAAVIKANDFPISSGEN